jgi:hypothetical protein
VLAETVARSARPASAPVGEYEAAVAAGMSCHVPPELRCHWYAWPVTGRSQPPFEALSVAPACAVPDTAGSTTFCGGSAARAALGAENA